MRAVCRGVRRGVYRDMQRDVRRDMRRDVRRDMQRAVQREMRRAVQPDVRCDVHRHMQRYVRRGVHRDMQRNVRRDVLLQKLVEAMNTGGPVGLKGQGGVGKSTVASALVHDEAVRRHFADGGILWINVSVEGGDPVASTVSAIASRMHSWLLTPRYGARDPPPSGDAAIGWIAAQVRERGLQILVVLDNATTPGLVAAELYYYLGPFMLAAQRAATSNFIVTAKVLGQEFQSDDDVDICGGVQLAAEVTEAVRDSAWPAMFMLPCPGGDSNAVLGAVGGQRSICGVLPAAARAAPQWGSTCTCAPAAPPCPSTQSSRGSRRRRA